MMHQILFVGGIVPFSNPSGILMFIEDSVQGINLTLINNDTVEVCIYMCVYVCVYVCVYMCMYVCMHMYVYVCMYKRPKLSQQKQLLYLICI